MIIRKQWNSLMSQKLFNRWKENDNEVTVDCDRDYVAIRADLSNIFNSVKDEAGNGSRCKYLTDLYFGIGLYDYFSLGNDNGFTLETAEDPQFWSYLSMRVIPDIVWERWDRKLEGNEGRFFSKRTRIWPGQIWWYIHLTYNQSLEITKNILSGEAFSTDTIMHLVDRTGSKGVFVDVYREIIRQYAFYDRSLLDDSKITYAQLFRNVMKLNTAKILLFEPPLCEGGVRGYVESLFREAVVRKS